MLCSELESCFVVRLSFFLSKVVHMKSLNYDWKYILEVGLCCNSVYDNRIGLLNGRKDDAAVNGIGTHNLG